MNKYFLLLSASFLIMILFFSYNFFSKNLAISYYDEEEWVGGSYFYQFYSMRDFDRKIWDTTFSKDQPMLTKLVFGAWLYPEYFKNRKRSPAKDFSEFLVYHGFSFVDSFDRYPLLAKSLGQNFVNLPKGAGGEPKELIKIYGEKINDNISLIQKVRNLNLFLLIITVMATTLLIKKQKGILYALVFFFFYGFNTLVVDSGLRAHSEALFLLFFNLGITFLFLYYQSNKNLNYLVSFSIIAGLAFSTKLNGIMLLFAYFVLETINLINENKKAKILESVLSLIMTIGITLTVFTILNPFVFPSPIKNTLEMFRYREAVVQYQKVIFPTQALFKHTDRYQYVAGSFFRKDLITKVNNIKLNSRYNFYGLILLLFFATGTYSELKNIRSGNKFSIFMFVFFVVELTTTTVYIQLSWARYLVHLVLFFIYYQTSGILLYLNIIKSRIHIGRLHK